MANKRLLSILMASAMTLSYVTANAASWDYEMDGSDVIITTPFEEATAVAAKGADVHVDVTQKTTVDADVEALGRTWKNYISKATADVYKVVFTINNFGTLINGYDETDSAYFAIYDMTINYKLDSAVTNVTSPKATLADGKTITPMAGKTSTAINLILPASSNNTKDTVWPGVNTVVDSGDIVAEAYMAVTPGSSITIKPGTASKINYAVESQDIGLKAGIWTNTNITLDDIVLGGSTEKPVDSITLDKDTIELDLNGTTTETLKATVLPDDATDKTVTWTTDNDKVATVDGGKVTAVGVGEAKITATAGGKTATCKVTVADTTPKPTYESKQEFVKEVDGKKLYKLGKIFSNAPATSKVSVFSRIEDKKRTTEKTIAELLDGVATGDTTIDVEITVGILTARDGDEFSFELVD